MKVIIYNRVQCEGPGDFTTSTKVVDAITGEITSEFEAEYIGANAVFAAYKTIQRAIMVAIKKGYRAISIDTNVESVVRELSGELNVNSTLYRYTIERLVGAELAEVKYNNE